jgi:hypothetical protein
MRNLYRGPSKDASYQILIHLAKRLQRRRLFFRNEPIRNKNCLWRLCLSTDRDEMNNLYRGPSKDASHQISIHLAKRLQRRFFFRNQPIRNKNCLLRPCLLTDRDEMCTFIEDLPKMLPTKFRFIWRSRFRGEDFLEMNQSETRIVCGGHVC